MILYTIVEIVLVGIYNCNTLTIQKLPHIIRLLTGERIFKCPHPGCTYDANQRVHLTRHLRNKHSKAKQQSLAVNVKGPGAPGGGGGEADDTEDEEEMELESGEVIEEKKRKNRKRGGSSGSSGGGGAGKNVPLKNKARKEAKEEFEDGSDDDNDKDVNEDCDNDNDNDNDNDDDDGDGDGDNDDDDEDEEDDDDMFFCLPVGSAPPSTTSSGARTAANQVQFRNSIHAFLPVKTGPIQCEYRDKKTGEKCPSSFSSAHSRNQHFQQCHTKRIWNGSMTGDYPCLYVDDSDNECPAAFTSSSKRDQHRYMHTGERPFGCRVPACGEAFKKKASLQTHLRTVHGVSV